MRFEDLIPPLLKEPRARLQGLAGAEQHGTLWQELVKSCINDDPLTAELPHTRVRADTRTLLSLGTATLHRPEVACLPHMPVTPG